jgi:hypothetical protein
VEGSELDVLLGFGLEKWRPQLIFVEDEFRNYSLHKHLGARGCKLVRRTSYNNWYVPRDATTTVFSLSTPKQLIRLYRKMRFGPVTGALKAVRAKVRR